MKPVIGITTYTGEGSAYYSVNSTYIDSVFAAGGIPVQIPVIDDEKDFESYMNILDGIIFTGGIDISPLTYGENPVSKINAISSRRDAYEIRLFKKAYADNMPIMGICRGNQLVNVALGGSLYQDINAQIPGSYGHFPDMASMDELYHSVDFVKGSKLHQIFGAEKMNVNSFHHQAIKKLGDGLVISAMSEDGIVEGVEAADSRFLIGVQWHPEGLTKRCPIFLKLFESLVSAAAR